MHRTVQSCTALPDMKPYLRLIDFRVIVSQKEKITLPRIPTGVSEFIYVTVKNPHPVQEY